MATWRGWVGRGSLDVHPVTSARLAASARPRNRLFPKTRSWFALDAPIELLSPLSVVRVLFAVAAGSWLVIGLTAPRSDIHRVGFLLIASFTAALWILLLVAKKVGVRASQLLTAFWTAAVAALVWCGRGTAVSLVVALYLVPVAVFCALFLGRRVVVVLQLAGAALLALALLPSLGPVRAPVYAGLGGLVVAVVPLTVLLLARSARRHDSVDADTGLPNGFGLARRLRERDQTALVVAAVCLGGIGDAREALGYQVGTELLRRAVEDLGQVLPSGALLGRVEGDELVVALAVDPTTAPAPDEAGRFLADTLVEAISSGRYLVGTIEVSLRAHVGLSLPSGEGTTTAEQVRRASLTARRAVELGLTVLEWDGDRDALTGDDLALLGDLRLAEERGELSLAYQPQVDGASGRPRSVEALLRWDSPVHGRVAPGRFIILAERTGLIDRLTRWVVAEALGAQVRWRRAGIVVPVSVNLSAKSLPRPELPVWILDRLHQLGLPTSCLTVEVTETAVADPVQAKAMLEPLHRLGIRISVDDFGTGFTSLAALPTLPLDELKIDQCFVLRAIDSPADEAIVRAVTELGHRLGLDVVAEGVETEPMAELMSDVGVDLLQGYHFARPMPEGELLAYLSRVGVPSPDGRARDAVVRRRSAV